MKRVLMYDPYHDCAFGAQRCMFTLARGLQARGVEPVIATGKEGKLSQAARAAGLRVEIIPIPGMIDTFGGSALAASGPRKLLMLLTVLMYGVRVSRRARRLGAESLCANDLRSVLYLLPSKLLLRKRLTWVIHGGHAFGALSSFGSWVSDALMTVSEAAGKAIPPRARKRAQSKVTVNYVGIDASAYAPHASRERRLEIRRRHNLPEDALLIMTAGSICHRKGYDTLLSALELIAGDGVPVHVAIAGEIARDIDAEYLDGLRKHTADRDLPVTFLGWSDNLPELLEASDIFVLASREEGLGIVTLEAMATALPVIVTYAGGSEETVVDGESGLIIQPGDPVLLADRLRLLIHDAGLRARLGARARQRCEEVFSLARFEERFSDLLQDA